MPFKTRERATPAEREHMGAVKRMNCVCCTLLMRQQESRTAVHHVDENGQARNHFLVLPLCWHCHQGPKGVHGDKSYLRILKKSQWELLAVVISWMRDPSLEWKPPQ